MKKCPRCGKFVKLIEGYPVCNSCWEKDMEKWSGGDPPGFEEAREAFMRIRQGLGRGY